MCHSVAIHIGIPMAARSRCKRVRGTRDIRQVARGALYLPLGLGVRQRCAYTPRIHANTRALSHGVGLWSRASASLRMARSKVLPGERPVCRLSMVLWQRVTFAVAVIARDGAQGVFGFVLPTSAESLRRVQPCLPVRNYASVRTRVG